MAHIHTERTRFEKTPPAWLPFGAAAGEYVNEVSGRSDIVAFVGEGAGHGAPACFIPSLAEMEIDTSVCFGEEFDPSLVGDIKDRSVQFEWPVVMGALIHEAYHAKYSLYDLGEVARHKDRFIGNLITWFEETRIEGYAARERKADRPFLRACSLRLVIGDLKDDEDFAARGIQAFSQLMLLTLARVDAGVLNKKDVEIIQDAADKMFDKKTMRKLRSIWKRAQSHRDHYNWKPQEKLAQEWVEALQESGNDPNEKQDLPDWLQDLMDQMMGEGSGSEGDPSDGESQDSQDGEGSGQSEADGKQLDAETKVHEAPGKGILEQMAEDTETEARDDVNDQAGQERAEATAAARSAAAAEKSTHESSASEVYGRGTGPGGGTTDSRLVESREPKPKERAAAVALAKELEKAQYRDRVVVKAGSIIPPGRLNTRRALAAAEQRSRGAAVTHEAWSRKMRKHTDDPSLTIGVLVDISGSMGYAMEPMASTAWIMSEAARRVQGTVSMVYYGDSVFPTLMPGQHMDKVQVYSAPDGTEHFNKAFEALNGKINLLDSSGARLLVIVSDIYYTGWERERTRYWIDRCIKAGVGVVVIPFEGESYARSSLGKDTKCEIIPHTKTKDLVGAANAIGAAAVKQLQAVQNAY